MDFKKTLELHLESIKNKDLDTFVSTIRLDDITLIMPNGKLIRDKEKFVELHKSWFADDDWELDYKMLNTEESEEMSSALAAVDYKDFDPQGNPVHMNYYLNLIFRKYDQGWFLVHDQNTIYHAE